jgi:hypothetical protein
VTRAADNVATKSDLALTEQALRSDVQAVQADLVRLEHRLILRGLGALVAGLSILFAALPLLAAAHVSALVAAPVSLRKEIMWNPELPYFIGLWIICVAAVFLLFRAAGFH